MKKLVLLFVLLLAACSPTNCETTIVDATVTDRISFENIDGEKIYQVTLTYIYNDVVFTKDKEVTLYQYNITYREDTKHNIEVKICQTD